MKDVSTDLDNPVMVKQVIIDIIHILMIILLFAIMVDHKHLIQMMDQVIIIFIRIFLSV